VRRHLLAVVLASIVLNAALGIVALVLPHFGELQSRVLGTSACVTGAGVLVLACLPAWERRRLGVVPPLGMGLSVLGFLLLVIGIWGLGDNATFGKAAGTVTVAAAFCVLMCVISLVRLAPGYRWVLRFAVPDAALLGAMIIGVIWAGSPGTWYPRAMGVVAVLLGASVVALPILHRASRGRVGDGAIAAGEGGRQAPAIGFCPVCGSAVAASAAGAEAGVEVACPACGARSLVRVLAVSGRQSP
jgi:DNA-directed RNA polymerase subunit RPC12/RpoP